MTSRLSTLLELIDEEVRLCKKTKTTLSHMIANKDKVVSNTTEKFESMKLKSLQFLEENICN